MYELDKCKELKELEICKTCVSLGSCLLTCFVLIFSMVYVHVDLLIVSTSGQQTPIANEPSQPNQQTTTPDLPSTDTKKRRHNANYNRKRSEV